MLQSGEELLGALAPGEPLDPGGMRRRTGGEGSEPLLQRVGQVGRRVTREVRDVVRSDLLEDREIASQDRDVVAGGLDERKPEALAP